MGQCDGERIRRLHHQGQGVVRRLDDVDGFDPDRRSGVVRGRVVLDDDQGVEQLGHADGVLDVGECDVVVLEQRRLCVGEPADDGLDGITARPMCSGGNGVDQQADHVVDSCDVDASTRHGGAEDHVGAPAEPAHRDAPGRADDGTDGDAVAACPLHDSGGHVGRDLRADLAEARCSGRAGRQRICQPGRLVDGVQLGAPRRERLLDGGGGDPVQVVAVAGRRGQRGSRVVVQCGEFPQHDGHRPAVGDDVVDGLNQDVPVRSSDVSARNASAVARPGRTAGRAARRPPRPLGSRRRRPRHR